MATEDLVWQAQGTTPAAIEAALRQMLSEVHARNEAYVPGRVLNLVCVVDRQWSGEVANRLRGVGRFHPSRTIVCAVEPGRMTLDARATLATPGEAKAGSRVVARELVVVDCGPQHLRHVDRIVDPLVVTDLPTAVWSPHGHPEAVDALAGLTQVVLVDTVDGDPREALRRAGELSEDRYVVDLAWLRSVPWRERLAATFDPPALRPELALIESVTVRHHPDSVAAALLFVGWLASRLGWEIGPLPASGTGLRGSAHARRQDVAIEVHPDPSLTVRGLSGVEVAMASGRSGSFERGPGGLRARYRRRDRAAGGAAVVEREWTILGASRGESGILGEGIRQALLRDPTYAPALAAARDLLG
jgi:glucose-6-phosphate dehydrogenase assembly protein OpcA